MKRKQNNRKLKDSILQLRSEGKSYREIANILECSKSVISYHCGNGSEKLRVKLYNSNKDNYQKAVRHKLNSFKSRHPVKSLINKTRNFKRNKTIVNNIPEGNFGYKDVLKKIGLNPICYLTGQSIDLYDTSSYSFDHIIPVAQGGTNDLSNLEICLCEANQAKHELMLDDFYKLCENVLKHRESKKD